MLRRLGLKAEENESNNSQYNQNNNGGRSSSFYAIGSAGVGLSARTLAGSESNSSSRKTVLTAPVDCDRQTRYYKVVYRGSVGVRASPTEPAPPNGQVSTRMMNSE